MAQPPDLQEFVQGFLVEAEEHLAASGKNLIALEQANRRREPDPRRVRELFRSLHTLKGLAAMVGIEPIVAIAHEMETILRNADRVAGRLSAPALDLLHRGLVAIQERVTQLSAHRPVSPAPAALVEALAEIQGAEVGAVGVEANIGLEPELFDKLTPAERVQLSQAAAQGLRLLRLEFVPSPERSDRGLNITRVREQVSKLAEIVKVVPRALPPSGQAPGGLCFVLLLTSSASDEELLKAADLAPDALREIPSSRPPHAPLESLAGEPPPPDVNPRSVIRVEVARLDDAMEKLSALIVTRSRLSRVATDLGAQGVDTRELRTILGENARQLRDLRGAILRARMVRVSELLDRIPLVVRGLTRANGKLVRVVLDAGRSELDKAVAERIFPAVVHLVRNAVDHGLEAPDERRAHGKPEEGQVRVTAFTRGELLELTVSDDGKGIDPAQVARRAGVPLPETDAALLEVISRAGFSTRDTASEVSGRGMGMDIVRRTVDELGGRLSLRNLPGQGTSFTAHVPLSVTIVDAFTFESLAHRFVVPVSAVEEILEVDPTKVVAAPGRAGRARFLERRGEPVALFSIARELGLTVDDAIPPKALVVRRNGDPFALGVDRMLGQQEVVVRPLEDPLVKVPGVTGSTDLGDGQPTLVLDLPALIAHWGREQKGAEA